MKQSTDIHFRQSEIRKITERFASFSQDECMTVDQFKKSMGLLGVGEAEYLSNRIFGLITDCSYCTCEEFINFLDIINHGSYGQKVQLSFLYLDRTRKGEISYNDIEVIINEIYFVWNFLTGEKVSTSDLTQIICAKLGISEHQSISFQQYTEKYQQQFNWYEFFNNPISPSRYHDTQTPYSTLRNSNNQFKIDQIQEYLKFLHQELETLLYDFQEEQSQEQMTRTLNGSPSKKGPKTTGAQQLQHTGDYGLNFRQTMPYLNQEQLSHELMNMNQHEQVDRYDVVATKLEQMSKIENKLFTNRTIVQPVEQKREKTMSKHQMLEEQRKKQLKNITKPSKKRRNIIYFGHQNWNIMLNLMLGIRRSIKSHYYKFEDVMVFTEEDLTCKYYHELIYKKNNKSIKQISEIFVVYAPKVFFYLRKYSNIDNYQVLKSVGLEDLIGNLLLGNLSSLSDQTSEGKSGSFIYYTQDSKIILKSISREEYVKLRSIIDGYATYLRKNPRSYLMRIYGLYKMKNKSSNRTIYFMIIGNVFDQEEVDIDERYDIKGATHKRQTLPDQSEQLRFSLDKNIALKDVDLMNNHSRIFDIDPTTKQIIFNQILKDAEFLKRHNIIEYSLLIGIHYVQPHEDIRSLKENSFFASKNHRSVLSQNKQEIYFFGIIDILSEFTAAKKIESGFFSILNVDISCKDPQEYFQRFKNFIFKYVFYL